MKNLLMLITVFSIALLGLTACKTSGDAPPTPETDPYGGANYPNIVFIDGWQDKVVADKPIVVESSDQAPMEVAVGIRNKTGSDMKIQYRYKFFDEKGRELKGASGWAYEPLPAKWQVQLKGNALNAKAAKWVLEIRDAR